MAYAEDYEKEFQKFIAGEATAADTMNKMAREFPSYNLRMVEALHAFRLAREEIIKTEENGKPISAVKADVLADATPQAHAYEVARVHVTNIEMIVKALSFQNENR